MQVQTLSNTKTDSMYLRKNNNTVKSNIVTNPNFTGFLNFFSKGKDLRNTKLNSDIAIFSTKELKTLRTNVLKEIQEIITMPATPGLKKRLDDLLHSPFVDYRPNSFGEMGDLTSLVAYNNEKGKGTEMYRQFITTSLAETLPLDILRGKDFKGIVSRNKPLKYLFENYHKMNENTPEASAVRKIVNRFKTAGISIKNRNYYLAESIINNQPLMCKTYINAFGISPETRVEYLSDYSGSTIYRNYLENIVDKFGKPKIMKNSVTNEKFFIVNPDKKVRKTGMRFDFDNPKISLTMYKLCGLSKSEEIKNIFDIIPVIKKYSQQMNFSNRNEDMLDDFLYKNKEYHPELTSVDFVKRYIKSFEGSDIKLSSLLDDFSLITHEPKFLKELDNEIELLSKANCDNDLNDLDLLIQMRDVLK